MLRKAFVVVALFWPTFAWAATYTFEGLNPGNLAGQDNWFVLPGNTSLVVTNGTGFDNSLVAKNPNTTGDTHFNGRTNNGNFSFGSFVGAAGGVLQFDTLVVNPTADNQNVSFFLGDPNLNQGASPQIQYGNGGSNTTVFAVRDANFSPTSFSAPFAVPSGDWVSVRLTMDFTANGGDGLGSVSFADLTVGGAFQPVTGLQNLPLGLTGNNIASWNSLWLRSDLANNVMVDNLTVLVSQIPEMNGAWAAGLFALFLGAHFLHRRVARG